MGKNAAAELAHKRATKLGPEICGGIATTAAYARWDAEGRRLGYQFYTYFVTFEDRYLKVGTSYSPLNRSWYYAKHPKDLDLRKAPYRKWVGCVKDEVLSESAAIKMLSFALVQGCREWFHLTPEVSVIIGGLAFVEPPPRVKQPAEMKEARAKKRAEKLAKPVLAPNTPIA